MENTPYADMPQVQRSIREYVAQHIVAIKGKEEGAADAVLEHAHRVTKQGLLQCGISEEIAERKHKEIANSMLNWELFNAWIGDV